VPVSTEVYMRVPFVHAGVSLSHLQLQRRGVKVPVSTEVCTRVRFIHAGVYELQLYIANCR